MYCYHIFIINKGGIDYAQGPHMVTFPVNNTISHYGVLIIDDNILETDKVFGITIDSYSLPFDVFPGDVSHAMIVIEDDDRKHFDVNTFYF